MGSNLEFAFRACVVCAENGRRERLGSVVLCVSRMVWPARSWEVWALATGAARPPAPRAALNSEHCARRAALQAFSVRQPFRQLTLVLHQVLAAPWATAWTWVWKGYPLGGAGAPATPRNAITIIVQRT